MEIVAYRVAGWGAGELVFEDGTLVQHELPTARKASRDGAHPLVERLRAYFRGEPVRLDDVVLELGWCTPFQRAVAEALRRVPYGELVTYGELAALAGRPNAHRAAGTFCAGNPLPLFLPCHRVVPASGLGSYGSLGPGYKARLLALEGVAV